VWFRPHTGYWFGLYKILQTAWYDNNPSRYRNWVDEPNNPDTCVVYTADGFDAQPCNKQHYYTCKKVAGSLSVSVIYSL